MLTAEKKKKQNPQPLLNKCSISLPKSQLSCAYAICLVLKTSSVKGEIWSHLFERWSCMTVAPGEMCLCSFWPWLGSLPSLCPLFALRSCEQVCVQHNQGSSDWPHQGCGCRLHPARNQVQLCVPRWASPCQALSLSFLTSCLLLWKIST